MSDQTNRPLYKIAAEIRKDWVKVPASANAYLIPMMQLNSVDDDYGFDSGRSVVRYFLSNAATWRGPEARRIKEELKRMVGA
jgi:hypothetical protein